MNIPHRTPWHQLPAAERLAILAERRARLESPEYQQIRRALDWLNQAKQARANVRARCLAYLAEKRGLTLSQP